jgi:RNA polymerase sigma-70 factor (ECF subfamily)
MEKLDRRHRQILTMRNTLHMAYEDIATSLGINVGTVKSRIARARENLRTLLTTQCPEFSTDGAPADYFLPNRATGRLAAGYA